MLQTIEQQRYDVLSSRPRVSSGRRAWLALRAALELKLA